MIALPAAAPLFGPGLIATYRYGDAPFLLVRVVALIEGFRAGVLFPRWSPDLAYGLGYPFFDFYGALPFYGAAALHLLGLPIVDSIKAMQLLGFLLCSLAMFGFARRHLGDAGGLVAAAAYGYAPYHLVNVYARGDSLGEFTAMGLLPLVLWALEAALAGSARGCVALAVAFAGLILSHNLSALLALPVIGLCVLVRGRSWRGLFAAASGGLLGVGLTCFYWLPALWDRRYVHLEHVTTGYFDFRNHFLELGRLVQVAPIYDYGLGGTADGALPFQVGLVQAVVAAVGLLAVVRARWLGVLALGVAVGYLVLASPATRPLWERVPNLQVVQFPWRALAGASFGLALMAGLPALALSGRARAAWTLAAVGAVVLAGSLGADADRWRIPPEDVTIANVQRYEYVTSAMGSTVRYEYLPLGAKERPWASWQLISGEALPRARFPVGTASVRRDGGFVVDASSPGGGRLVLEHHFFQGWEASLPLSASDPEGFLQVDVPAGAHEVRFRFGATRLRQAAGVVSLGVLLLLAVAVLPAARLPGGPPVVVKPAGPVVGLLAVGAIVLLAARMPWSDVVAPAALVEAALDRRFSHAHAPWPYVEAGGHRLGPARLLGYRQPGATIAGEAHAVELHAEGAGEVTARVVAPAETILDAPRTIAETRAMLGETARLSFDLPAATPPGLYRVEVALGSDRRWLAPFRVLAPPQRPVPSTGTTLAQFGDQLALESVALEPGTTVARPGFKLRWRALRAPDHDWRVSLRLVDEQGNLWGSQDGRPVDGFYPTYLWPAGAVVDERRDITPLAGTPPGPYRLEVRVYSLAGRALDVLDARGAAIAPLFRSAPIQLFEGPAPVPAESPSAPLTLVEAQVGERVADAGARLPLSLLLRADRPPGRDLDVVLALGQSETRVPVTFPASGWRAGELVRVQHGLLVPPELPAGRHRLSARLVDAGGQVALGPVDLGQIEVRNRPRRFEAPAPRVAVGAVFGGAIELVGFDAPRTTARPGEKVGVTLWWRARGRIEKSYTVFVHLLDAERRVRGQVDRVPGEGTLPTSGWAVGEVVEDRYEVPVDASATSGPYVLEVGLYDAVTGERLRVEGGADHLDLVKVGIE